MEINTLIPPAPPFNASFGVFQSKYGLINPKIIFKLPLVNKVKNIPSIATIYTRGLKIYKIIDKAIIIKAEIKCNTWQAKILEIICVLIPIGAVAITQKDFPSLETELVVSEKSPQKSPKTAPIPNPATSK